MRAGLDTGRNPTCVPKVPDYPSIRRFSKLTGPTAAKVKRDGSFSFTANRSTNGNDLMGHETVPVNAHVWGRFRVGPRIQGRYRYKVSLHFNIDAGGCVAKAKFKSVHLAPHNR